VRIHVRIGSLIGPLMGLLLCAAPALAEDAAPLSRDAIRPLLIGSVAPAAAVLSLDGEELDLADIVTQKPTVLIFFRGGW
jgi:hypothetical protein